MMQTELGFSKEFQGRNASRLGSIIYVPGNYVPIPANMETGKQSLGTEREAFYL